jgi:hypothetical protein
MTTYVLGAGASHDAGYPLATGMASQLLRWMGRSTHDPTTYAGRYPSAADYIQSEFPSIEDVEDLVSRIHLRIDKYEHGTQEQRLQRAVLANEYGVFKNAVRDWFAEIQYGPALNSTAYKDFARDIVVPGDCVITFNYDVSLERELRLAGKFEVGDGYGFRVEGLPTGSKVKVLKLHGSTNWLALLFASFQPGGTLSDRPVIAKNELSFLGYADAADPRFERAGAALPVMILPARKKDFYFAVSTGDEYMGFWDALWGQARGALDSTDRIVICGYSLLSVDDRACELLLHPNQRDPEILVASGCDTERIVDDYRRSGFARVRPADEVLFEKWVNAAANVVAGGH